VSKTRFFDDDMLNERRLNVKGPGAIIKLCLIKHIETYQFCQCPSYRALSLGQFYCGCFTMIRIIGYKKIFEEHDAGCYRE
jgi:hypothetical protein